MAARFAAAIKPIRAAFRPRMLCSSSFLRASAAPTPAEAAPAPTPLTVQQNQVDAKVANIVEQIASLNLLEASSLVAALKTRLNIQDIVVAAPQSATAPAGGAAGGAADAAAEAEKAKPVEKTKFKVTLAKFDAASKAKVIKEVKAMLNGASLVEAKKFVEGAPKVIKEDANKDEAEKIKKTLEAVGATVTLE